MTVEATRLLEDALKLPEGDRADLAACLWASLERQADEMLDPAWEAEIKRRIEDLDAGRAKLVPWEEARKRIFGDG